MNYLLLYKPGALTKPMIDRARRAGYCCIETDNFESVKIVNASIPVNKDDLFKAAMFAIHAANTKDGYQNKGPKTIFGERLAEVLSK